MGPRPAPYTEHKCSYAWIKAAIDIKKFRTSQGNSVGTERVKSEKDQY